MKSIRQKNNMIKRARAGVKGLVISWHDKDPLRDTQAHIQGTVTHKSPLFRLCAQKVFSDFKDWIVHHQPFHWLITITVVFCIRQRHSAKRNTRAGSLRHAGPHQRTLSRRHPRRAAARQREQLHAHRVSRGVYRHKRPKETYRGSSIMKMAKPSAKDIAAAEELQQVLNALNQNQRWGCAALEDTPDFFQLIDDDEFDPEQDRHAQALYNKLVTLMWENPSFHNRVISGMCHVIMYEKNEIIDPDSDCIDLHPRFAEIWNDLKRETQAARYWNQRYHQVVAERDEARAKLAAMESQKPHRIIISDGFTEQLVKQLSISDEKAAKRFNWEVRPLYAQPVPIDKPPGNIKDIEVTDAMASAFNQAICDDAMNDQGIEEIKIGLRAAISHLQPLPLNFYELEIKRLVAVNDSLLANERRLIDRLRPAPSHSQQRCNIGNAESHDKELQVTIEHNGKIFGVDESISEFVQLLNYVGLETVASCSGHGHRPANIALKDGREIIIARDYEEARKIDRIFPVDINGDRCPNHESEQGGAE